MADLKPDLNAITAVFGGGLVVITLPGLPPVAGHWHEQKPAGEPFPNDAGTYSLTKSQRRGSLRFDELPARPRPDVSWPPPGTMIDLGVTTLTVTAVDYYDIEVAHVIVTTAIDT